MGFNYMGYGNIHPCRIENNQIIYTLPSGMEVTHETQLNVNIPEQCNLFNSPYVQFVLFHEGKKYVGRRDGSISIYKGDMLWGMDRFAYDFFPRVMRIGVARVQGTLHEIHIDLRDNLSVYCGNVCETTAKQKLFISKPTLSYTYALSLYKSDCAYIAGDGGEMYGINEWVVQERRRRQACPLYL